MFFIFSLLGLGLPLGAMESDGEGEELSTLQQKFNKLHGRHIEAMKRIKELRDISGDSEWNLIVNEENNNFGLIEEVVQQLIAGKKKLEGLMLEQDGSCKKAVSRLCVPEEGISGEAFEAFQEYYDYTKYKKKFLSKLIKGISDLPKREVWFVECVSEDSEEEYDDQEESPQEYV